MDQSKKNIVLATVAGVLLITAVLLFLTMRGGEPAVDDEVLQRSQELVEQMQAGSPPVEEPEPADLDPGRPPAKVAQPARGGPN